MTEPTKKIIVITAPSGAGKTSITKHLMKCFPQLAFSVSATTRQPRVNELDGKDYYFISRDEFSQYIEQNAFIEWEMVYEGVYYGTLKNEMDKIWHADQVPVLDIDVKGALQIKKLYPEQTITLFIAPPSIESLRERLMNRGTDSAASIEKRILKASSELAHKNEFDQIILNDDLQKACDEATSIINVFLGSAS
jgi:guanylate kinase